MAETARKGKAVTALRSFLQSIVASGEEPTKAGFFSRLFGRKE